MPYLHIGQSVTVEEKQDEEEEKEDNRILWIK